MAARETGARQAPLGRIPLLGHAVLIGRAGLLGSLALLGCAVPAGRGPEPRPPAAPGAGPKERAGVSGAERIGERPDPLRSLDLRHPPPEVVRAILELADVSSSDAVRVLGCGDGGVAAGAALLRRARVVAIDPSAEVVARARETARRAGVEDLVEVRTESLAAADFAGASVLVILLPRSSLREIEGKLLSELRPGTRVVTWIPAMVRLGAQDEEAGALHFYRVPGDTHPKSLAPYVQTPLPVVEKMLEMARLTKDDVLYDLGCGDGRIVVEAAKRYGARGVGIDFDRQRIEEARELARREGVEALVEFRQEDILEADISPATVVTLFLLPDTNRLLKPKLRTLRDGARILSHQFDTEGWPYRQKETMVLPDGSTHAVYLWEMAEALRRN